MYKSHRTTSGKIRRLLSSSNFHLDFLCGVLLHCSGVVEAKSTQKEEEIPVYFMSSISSCSNDLCALSSLGQASFKSTYHVGVSRMEALESASKATSSEGRDIEEEEFVYRHKPVSRRTFICTSYTTSRPLSQCISASNKRRRFCDLDESGEAPNPNPSGISAPRLKEALYDYDDGGDCIPGSSPGPDSESERVSLNSLSRSLGSDVCRGLAGATSLIESFANPSLRTCSDSEGDEDECGCGCGEATEGRGDNEGNMEGADYFVDSPGQKEESLSKVRSMGWEIPPSCGQLSQMVGGQEEENEEDDGNVNKSGSFLGGLEWF